MPYLEYCLDAAFQAIKRIEAELIVVDNHSTDNTIGTMQKRFPSVKLLVNKENTGFARACNQGAALAQSNLLLFLNPDCIISASCLHACLEFLEQNTDTGALGVQMINGSGEYLPESKRGNPDPLSSFYKLTGLSSFFQRSKHVNAYYHPHTNRESIEVVPVLSGAFMMVKKPVFEKAGGFDERYFMYAEDIDLSLSMEKLGYKNIYLGNQVVLHFKGTSTPGSASYNRHFYGAMKLFVKKYWSNYFKRSLLLTGILMREKISLLKMIVRPKKNTYLAVTDWNLKGDEEAIAQAKELLSPDPHNIIRSIPVKGCVILLCLGTSFSYEEAIRMMKENPGFPYRLYKSQMVNIIG